MMHGGAARLQLGTRLGIGSAVVIDYRECIPNNVDLAGNVTRLPAGYEYVRLA